MPDVYARRLFRVLSRFDAEAIHGRTLAALALAQATPADLHARKSLGGDAQQLAQFVFF